MDIIRHDMTEIWKDPLSELHDSWLLITAATRISPVPFHSLWSYCFIQLPLPVWTITLRIPLCLVSKYVDMDRSLGIDGTDSGDEFVALNNMHWRWEMHHNDAEVEGT